MVHLIDSDVAEKVSFDSGYQNSNLLSQVLFSKLNKPLSFKPPQYRIKNYLHSKNSLIYIW
jgi:hypothetical protein